MLYEVITSLAADYNLLLITKGDLFDQEGKIAQSGLANYFVGVEIVSEKSPETYESLLGKYAISPDRFMMVGNSLRSDIFPVLDIGSHRITSYNVCYTKLLRERGRYRSATSCLPS